MMNKVINGFSKLFSSFSKVLALVLFCLGLSAAFVFPLWKWALSSPISYTWTVIIVASLLVLYVIVNSFRKKTVKSVVKILLKFFIPILAFIACIYFILLGYRILLPFILIGTFILYGVVNVWLK